MTTATRPNDAACHDVTCIVYASRAVGPWTAAALGALRDQSGRRNAERAVTGRLLYLHDSFVQVLEGGATVVGPLYDAICRDPRHADIRLLLNCRIPARAFPEWGMDVVLPATLSTAEAAGADNLLRAAMTDCGSDRTGQRALTLMRQIGLPLMRRAMRTPPQQPRSQLTVDRLLDAAHRMTLETGVLPKTVQDVALASGVGVKTAYRYFSSVEDMVRLLVRTRQARGFAAFRARLAAAAITSDRELARFVGTTLLSDYLVDPVIPRIRQLVMEKYHDIAFAELWTLAGQMMEVRSLYARDTGDQHRRLRLAMALSGVAGAAKMAALHDPAALHSEYMIELITGLVQTALQAGQPAAARHRGHTMVTRVL